MPKTIPMLDDQQFTDSELDQLSGELANFVQAHPAVKVRHRRRIRYGVAFIGAIAVLGGGTATAVSILQPVPVTDHGTARCYQELSTNFGDDFPGATVAAAIPGDGSSDGQTYAPISICALLWENGAFPLRDYRSDPPKDAPYPVPQLVGCVLPDGTAAVFPGTDSDCGLLGLAVALPG